MFPIWYKNHSLVELFFRRNYTGRFLISHSKLPCYCIYSICMLKCLFMVIRCVMPRLILFVSLYCMGGWCPGPLKPSCLFLKFCTQYTWICNIEYCWKMLISILYNTKSRQQCMRWHPWQKSVNANRLNTLSCNHLLAGWQEQWTWQLNTFCLIRLLACS